MTDVTFYAPINMSNFDWFYQLPTTDSDLKSTAIRMTDGIKEAVYFGGFQYGFFTPEDSTAADKLGAISGTMTGYDLYEDQIIRVRMRDFSVDAITALVYVDLGATGDPQYRDFDNELLRMLFVGADSIQGSAFNDILKGFDGNDSIGGGARLDTLYGGAGLDTLDGGAGNDRLIGENSNDTLIGGLGRDLLIGGAGGDKFVYTSVVQSGTTASTADEIRGLGINDRIDVSSIDAISGGTNNEFTFVGSANFAGAGQIRAVDTADGVQVLFNVSGFGGAEMSILITGITSSDLNSDHFIL